MEKPGSPALVGSQATQGRAAEYTALRQEIVQYNQLNMLALAISLPIAAALIAYGFTQRSTLALFSAAGVLDVSLWFVSAHVYASMLIATYLNAIVESKESGLFWEHMVFAMRSGGRAPARSYAALWAVFPLASIGCILLGWTYAAPATLSDVVILATVAGLLVIFQLIPFARAYWYSSRRFYDRMCDRWAKAYASA